MRFVVQLEQGRKFETSIDFGGGCGYALICPGCSAESKFLWQR